MKDKENDELPSKQRRDIAHAGDVDLGLGHLRSTSLVEQGRLWAHKQLAKAQADVLEAKSRLHEAATSFLRSQEALQEELERNLQWRENPDLIRARVAEEFDAEEQERQIKKLEREAVLAEAKLKVAEARLREEEADERLENSRERRQRKNRMPKTTEARKSTEDIFRDEVDEIFRLGTGGKFTRIAEEKRQDIIKERGGEENLTEEDLTRLEQLFEIARRKDLSKS